MTSWSGFLLIGLSASLTALPLHAQNIDPADLKACTGIESDAQRLACYDHAAGRSQMPAAQKRVGQPPTPESKVFHAENEATTVSQNATAPLSLLDSRWELSPQSKLGTFNLRGYKPIYVLPVFATTHQNNLPYSPNPVNAVQTPLGMQNVEGKFQLSLKTKIWQGVFGDTGDLWLGYTQDSYWQVYNAKLSRPFRETDYEPEAMLVFNTDYHVFGWNGRLLGIGLDHQSNGQSDPESRSWNRVMGQIGFERVDWTIVFRPWWRIPEPAKDDNNPDISNYMGRADMQIIHEWNGQEFSLLLRDSLRGGSQQHGAGRLTWSFPLAGNLRGYVELFKGYGENILDYNHNATYLGVGISLLDWY
ncbi:phospholipase A [Dyella nitratireducens]|uniref:Phospholipase A1 n=1 Tax=Dyella nitratireducens TaxID=1849580 RepID=A0ABQ1GKD0_9GAMM|nr:phospholipase A [Dyella nitratireducens]GGA45550.1 phospholipase [Dyella nitratireducens]GLQ41334.1 phospholipase [Dyella nitratireducens]